MNIRVLNLDHIEYWSIDKYIKITKDRKDFNSPWEIEEYNKCKKTHESILLMNDEDFFKYFADPMNLRVFQCSCSYYLFYNNNEFKIEILKIIDKLFPLIHNKKIIYKEIYCSYIIGYLLESTILFAQPDISITSTLSIMYDYSYNDYNVKYFIKLLKILFIKFKWWPLIIQRIYYTWNIFGNITNNLYICE